MARTRKKLVKYSPPRPAMVTVHPGSATSGACRKYAHEKCKSAGFRGDGYGVCIRRETDFCKRGFRGYGRCLS